MYNKCVNDNGSLNYYIIYQSTIDQKCLGMTRMFYDEDNEYIKDTVNVYLEVRLVMKSIMK